MKSPSIQECRELTVKIGVVVQISAKRQDRVMKRPGPWFAYQTIYFLLWLMVFMVMMVLPFRKAFRQTMALKREEDWFVGSKRMILGDLRVAQMKNQRSASPWLFLIPAVMSIALMRWAVSKDSQLWGLAVAGMAMTVLFFLILLAMRRTKAKVYSMDSEVNLVLNQAKRRAVSYLSYFIYVPSKEMPSCCYRPIPRIPGYI